MKAEVIESRHHNVTPGVWEVLSLVYQEGSDVPWYVLDCFQSKPKVIRGEFVRAVGSVTDL